MHINVDNNTDDKAAVDLELKEESFINDKSDHEQDTENFATEGVFNACIHM